MSGLDGTIGVSAAVFLSDLLLEGALLLIVTAIASWVFRKRSAATRYALWMFGLLTVLALPFLSLTLPQWTVPVFDVPLSFETVGSDPASPVGGIESPSAAGAPVTTGLPAPPPDAHGSVPLFQRHTLFSRMSLLSWIALVWLAGSLVLIARLAFDFLRTAAVTHSATGGGNSMPAKVAREVAGQLGIRRPIGVVFGDLQMPAVWGCVRPVVVLPREAIDWSWDRCKVVLTHELAHVKRCDYVFHLLSQLTCAINWPNPAVWLAAHRARAEQERSCDDIVLRQGTRSAEYASHLLEIARAASTDRGTVRGALAMARESDLKRRMRAILDTSSNRTPLTRRDTLLSGFTVVLMAFPISSGSVWNVETDLQVVRAIAASNNSNERAIRTLREAALSHPDVGTRVLAIRTLQQREQDCDIVTTLVQAVKDQNRDVSENAARTLSALDDPQAVAPLAILSQTAGSPQVRAAAILGLTGHHRVRAVEAVHRALSDGEYEVRLRAVQALGVIGDERAAASLRCALWDRDHRIRLAAISALYVIDQRSRT